MSAIAGNSLSPGRASGPVVTLALGSVDRVEQPQEALELVAKELERLAADLHHETAQILTAQAAIARDPELAEAVTRHRGEGEDPSAAIRRAAEPFVQALAGARGEYQRQRAIDVEEVVDRAIGKLEGTGGNERRPPVPGILVSRRVSPADTALFPSGQLLGIVSVEGGANSHAAIVARSLGIPAVTIDAVDLELLSTGDWIELDGAAGRIDREGRGAARGAFADPTTAQENPAEPAPSPFKGRIRANLGSAAEAAAARSSGLVSSGLIRTEFLLGEPGALKLGNQLKRYRELAELMPGELVFRLLDAGADKPLPGVEETASPNPALGIRGARLLGRHPELLRDQIRALCRLGEHERISVMVPMVTLADELRHLRELAEGVFAEEQVELRIGAMVEVPIAALAAPELCEAADFLSIGTNDLLQYLFAADRGMAELDELTVTLPGAAWDLLRSVIDAGISRGLDVGVCGELASEPGAAGVLLGMGATYVSIAPGAYPLVAESLRSHSESEWHRLAGGRSADR